MNQKQEWDILLVRFTKAQRAFIRKQSKRSRVSEAQVVRAAVHLLSKEKITTLPPASLPL